MSETADVKAVVIAGGGVAAMEAVLALQHYAGERVSVTVLTPSDRFTYRPASVGEPFNRPLAPSYDLQDVLAGTDASCRIGELASVDAGARKAYTTSGDALAYDALLLATGARPSDSFPNAITLNPDLLDEQLHGLVQDVEGGYVSSIAFIVPGRPIWPLPLYELAIMTARRAYEMDESPRVALITPESSPLGLFGSHASKAVEQLLADSRVELMTARECAVHPEGRVTVYPGEEPLLFDRVVALPELHGRAVPGLPHTVSGSFVTVDRHSRVVGLKNEYAAGDVTDFPIKQGGIAAQQADAAAESIAHLAGVKIFPAPLVAELSAVLWGGPKPLYLDARAAGDAGTYSRASTEPMWDPPSKIHARFLAPRLEMIERARTASR